MVIGGGLAGIAAACELAGRGRRVTLLEKRPFLGGRAFSFADPVSGHAVDNGQHVFLRCCTAYIGLLERLGALDRTTLQPAFRAPVMDRRGRVSSLFSIPWLPAPLHLLPSLLLYRHLGPLEKLGAARAVLAAAGVDLERRRKELEGQTFLQWLEARGQGPGAIRSLWDLIALAALNDHVGSVTAYMGVMALQVGMARGRHGGDIGYSRVGLTELLSGAARRYLEERGGRVLAGHPAASVLVEGGRATGVEMASLGGSRRGSLEASTVVVAVPWDAVASLLPPEWSKDPFFQGPAGLEPSPILGVHVWYDRPVMDQEFLAVLDSPAQWVFNRSRMQGLEGPGQYLCVSVSGAADLASMDRATLRSLFLEELARLFPAAREARVRRFLAVKQMRATFRSTPGAEALRPSQATPVEGLFLAGDWTETGWPSTMESAVRSGILAARMATAPASAAEDSWRGSLPLTGRGSRERPELH